LFPVGSDLSVRRVGLAGDDDVFGNRPKTFTRFNHLAIGSGDWLRKIGPARRSSTRFVVTGCIGESLVDASAATAVDVVAAGVVVAVDVDVDLDVVVGVVLVVVDKLVDEIIGLVSGAAVGAGVGFEELADRAVDERVDLLVVDDVSRSSAGFALGEVSKPAGSPASDVAVDAGRIGVRGIPRGAADEVCGEVGNEVLRIGTGVASVSDGSGGSFGHRCPLVTSPASDATTLDSFSLSVVRGAASVVRSIDVVFSFSDVRVALIVVRRRGVDMVFSEANAVPVTVEIVSALPTAVAASRRMEIGHQIRFEDRVLFPVCPVYSAGEIPMVEVRLAANASTSETTTDRRIQLARRPAPNRRRKIVWPRSVWVPDRGRRSDGPSIVVVMGCKENQSALELRATSAIIDVWARRRRRSEGVCMRNLKLS
jgi:hypothetical protein